MKYLVKISVVLGLLLGAQASYGAISKNGRQLVVITNLDNHPGGKWSWLYQFLDSATVSLSKKALGPVYKNITVLYKGNATSGKFTNALQNLAKSNNVKAIDTIFHLHGNPNRAAFANGNKTIASIRAVLEPSQGMEKLRLMYNLACYGATHRQEFIRSGFRTAVGARKVNTSSGSEFPLFLAAWVAQKPINSVFNNHNGSITMNMSDAAAMNMGFPDADSWKVISGTRNLIIRSNAK
ncbi:MAG: hypothetical protein HRU19_20245 [Pseudobacteriovorax sp.]|nr:hypothetical protein [Pseudobacteriovorax sp.]